MTTARDIMTPDAECIGANESALLAAHKMADLGVGALPICGADERLKGVLTDRDIVVKVLAADKDPAEIKAGDLAQGEAVTIGADDDASEILRTMSEHKVRRLPVIDGHTLVGMVAQADMWPGHCPIRLSATSSRRCPPADQFWAFASSPGARAAALQDRREGRRSRRGAQPSGV